MLETLNYLTKYSAIATDPPYGISASTGGEESQNLYTESLVKMEELLMENGNFAWQHHITWISKGLLMVQTLK